MRLAIINDRRVAYETSGDPNGRPALIIHGAWGGPSSTLWNGPRIRWQVPTDGLKMIYYDRRCAGLSQYDTEPFTLKDLANDAVDLLDYLGIEQAAVIATSAGGPIGMRLAIDHPERVESLVLLNTGASLMSMSPTRVNMDDPFVSDRLETVARRLELLEMLETQGIEIAVAVSEDEWRTPPESPSAEPSLALYRESRQRALVTMSGTELERLAHGALLNMHAQQDVDLLDEARQITDPVLILHGDADTTVPIAFGRAIGEVIRQAELSVLNGQGHGLIVNPVAQRVVINWL